MKKNIKLFITVALFIFIATTVFGQSVTEILTKYDDNAIFDTVYTKAKLEIKDSIGTSYNEFESYGKRNGDTLIVVTSGPDKGQKILRLENAVYLYYPDAEEIIRLQGSALKESVMGSDFTYEDMTGDNSTLNNYNGELLGSETVNGFDCFHVMLTAKTKKQLYQKMELFIDKATYAEVKSIVYSASGKALSEKNASDFKKVSGKTVGTKGSMQNLLKKSSITTMTITDIQIGIDIPESTFSRDELSW